MLLLQYNILNTGLGLGLREYRVLAWHAKPWVHFSSLHGETGVAHTYNPSAVKVDLGASEVPGHPGLHSECQADLGYVRPCPQNKYWPDGWLSE